MRFTSSRALLGVDERCIPWIAESSGSPCNHSMLSELVLVTSRASFNVWSMSTPAACLLLSQFAPATARLFLEFRRLRGSLPPAEAQILLAACTEEDMQDAFIMAVVRLCACQTSRALESCRTAKRTSAAQHVLHLCRKEVQALKCGAKCPAQVMQAAAMAASDMRPAELIGLQVLGDILGINKFVSFEQHHEPNVLDAA